MIVRSYFRRPIFKSLPTSRNYGICIIFNRMREDHSLESQDVECTTHWQHWNQIVTMVDRMEMKLVSIVVAPCARNVLLTLQQYSQGITIGEWQYCWYMTGVSSKMHETYNEKINTLVHRQRSLFTSLKTNIWSNPFRVRNELLS